MWTFLTFLADRFGAKIILGIIGSVCLTTVTALRAFPTPPTFMEFTTVLGILIGVPIGIRMKEKFK